MPKNTLNKMPEVTEDSLIKLANERSYQKPLFYRSEKFVAIMDIETGFLSFVVIDAITRNEITTVVSVAEKISELPSTILKECLAYTDNLEEEFNRQRNESIIIGRCFVFAVLRIDGDALKPERESKDSNQWTEEVWNQTAYYYRALLELLKVGFKTIKKAFPDMPFNTPEELFIEIVRDERDSFFERICTNDFLQMTTDSLADFWRGIIQGEDYEELEKRCIAQGLGSIHKEIWLQKCLDVLRKKAKKNFKIQNRLKAYSTESNSLAEAKLKACEARTSEGKVKKSIQWRRGVAHTFDKRNQPTIPMQVYKT